MMNRSEATKLAIATYNDINEDGIEADDVLVETIANMLICEGCDGELALDVAEDVVAEEKYS